MLPGRLHAAHGGRAKRAARRRPAAARRGSLHRHDAQDIEGGGAALRLVEPNAVELGTAQW